MTWIDRRRRWARAGALLLLAAALAGAARAQGTQDPAALARGAHLLRRIGFGPTPTELAFIAQIGEYRYIAQQLAPDTVDDGDLKPRLDALQPEAGDEMGYTYFPRRWYVRMIYSKRQLLEKMTLIWHQHFATSVLKAGMQPSMLAVQEETMRRNALGNFRQLLTALSVDPAMLVWLDNNENNGQGDKPPNENYARELMQLFALGVSQLQPDGTVRLDDQGRPIPAYSERDVKEMARALTGWYVKYDETAKRYVSGFNPALHDGGAKTILGQRLPGRQGADGAREVEDAIGVLMVQPTMAPFIAGILVREFATETPSPRYVERVAQSFASSNGDLRATMFTLLTDREFWAPDTMRSQPKTPIEHLVGLLRGLEAESQGKLPVDFGYVTRHLVYYPPTVFSFYPPGEKEKLLATDTVLMRDNAGLVLLFTSPGNDSWVDLDAVFYRNQIRTTLPEMVDDLSRLLLQAPLEAQARARILKLLSDYGQTDRTVIRIAIWLVLCSPDYQRN